MAQNIDTKGATGNAESAQKDYQENFMPAVHRIGRATMGAAFVLAFLPVIYFILVKGYGLPFSTYLNVGVAIASVGIGMWLTEPLAYWPTLGSAGTYIAYLSGNVGGMRFPVSLAVQSAMKADINKPRGQVVTIVGIVASVFSNLAILFLMVLFGDWLLGVLPAPVTASFAFVMPCLFGGMFCMRFNGKDGIVKGFLRNAPYLAVAVLCKFLVVNVFSSLSHIGTAISVGVTILFAYVMFKVQTSKQN